MANNKNIIKEGQIFAAPIGNKFAIGLIARYIDDGILAYFLNKAYDRLPHLHDLEFNKNNIIYIVKASSLGLEKGLWTILGNLENWNRDYWNVPVFYKNDLVDGTSYKVFYDDRLKFIKQEIMNEPESLVEFPKDGVAGYGFVEKRLVRLLGESQ